MDVLKGMQERRAQDDKFSGAHPHIDTRCPGLPPAQSCSNLLEATTDEGKRAGDMNKRTHVLQTYMDRNVNVIKMTIILK